MVRGKACEDTMKRDTTYEKTRWGTAKRDTCCGSSAESHQGGARSTHPSEICFFNARPTTTGLDNDDPDGGGGGGGGAPGDSDCASLRASGASTSSVYGLRVAGGAGSDASSASIGGGSSLVGLRTSEEGEERGGGDDDDDDGDTTDDSDTAGGGGAPSFQRRGAAPGAGATRTRPAASTIAEGDEEGRRTDSGRHDAPGALPLGGGGRATSTRDERVESARLAAEDSARIYAEYSSRRERVRQADFAEDGHIPAAQREAMLLTKVRPLRSGSEGAQCGAAGLLLSTTTSHCHHVLLPKVSQGNCCTLGRGIYNVIRWRSKKLRMIRKSRKE